MSIPKDVKKSILVGLEKSIDLIDLRASPEEIAADFNKRLKSEFEKERKSAFDNGMYSIPVVFVGQYRVDPENLNQTMLFRSEGYGCSPIPLNPNESIIARAIINGTHQHVSNVDRDPSHWECDPNSKHEEVYPIFSEPYSRGRFKGYSAVVAVHDIDFRYENVLSLNEARGLGKIISHIGKKIFPSEPEFQITSKDLIYRLPGPGIIREMFQNDRGIKRVS